MKTWLKIAVGVLGLSVAGLCFAANPASPSAKVAKQLQQAQALVQSGKFQDAYALLQPLEFEQAGNVQYDYLLGVSAVNAGKPDRATIALERVVATDQNYGDSRQWLGIAYFQSGDMERSKKEFNALLAQNASPQVKATANQYLAAIKQQEDAKELAAKKAKQPYLVGNVETGFGRDSNIGAYPQQDYGTAWDSSLSFPRPAQIPTGISDNFGMVNLNIEGRVPFASAGTYGFLSVDSNHRAYNAHSVMNTHTSIVKGGVSVASSGNTYRVDVSRKGYRQDGLTAGTTSNSSQNSVGVDARLMLAERDFWALSAQYNTPRFTNANTQDTQQTVLGTNYMHIFAHEGSPLVYLAFTHTRDRAVRESQPLSPAVTTTNVSRNTNALMLYTQYSFIKEADVLAMWMDSGRRDSSPYARSDLIASGRDNMRVGMLGMNWRPAKDWVVHPQWMRIKNDSNIALYSFIKTEYSLSVKREFK